MRAEPLLRAERSTWLCDSHAVLKVLVRFGHGADPRVRAGVARMTADLTVTTQGTTWPCRADPSTGFRGPGCRGDLCPQVTLESSRTYARLPEADRPPDFLGAARVALGVWRNRGVRKRYQFGHGKAFKTVERPPTWCVVLAVLDTLGRFGPLWQSTDDAERRALAELIACLIAYNLDDAGRVVLRSASRGFEDFSLGRKEQTSAFASAVVHTVLHRLRDLAPDARAVDVDALRSSKGGAGLAVPPAT